VKKAVEPKRLEKKQKKKREMKMAEKLEDKGKPM